MDWKFKVIAAYLVLICCAKGQIQQELNIEVKKENSENKNRETLPEDNDKTGKTPSGKPPLENVEAMTEHINKMLTEALGNSLHDDKPEMKVLKDLNQIIKKERLNKILSQPSDDSDQSEIEELLQEVKMLKSLNSFKDVFKDEIKNEENQPVLSEKSDFNPPRSEQDQPKTSGFKPEQPANTIPHKSEPNHLDNPDPNKPKSETDRTEKSGLKQEQQNINDLENNKIDQPIKQPLKSNDKNWKEPNRQAKTPENGIKTPNNDAKTPDVINQKVNKPIKQTTFEPVHEPNVNSIKEAGDTPVKEPAFEPVKEIKVDPIKQPDEVPIEELDEVPVEEPYTEPVVELTEEQKLEMQKKVEIEKIYKEGMSQINSTNKDIIKKGYVRLSEAADLGHTDAKVEFAFGQLFGFLSDEPDIKNAKLIFEEQSALGHTKAQAGLAFMYSTGLETNSSQAKSLVYLTFSALGGDVLGSMMLGYRYFAGNGVSQSCEMALNYYKVIAEKVAEGVKLSGGNVITRIRLVEDEENSGSKVDEDLVQYYQFLADKGDVNAQLTLGKLSYQGGRGFEQNPLKAFEYFNKAAESGDPNAQGYLGKIFAEGSNAVQPNNEAALRYFKLSANQGNAIGQSGLGLMYLYGKGVDVDYNLAFKYFQASADQGYPEGQLHLGNMYFNGHSVARDFKQALRFFNLAAQNGHLLALYYLAKMHSSGTGVVRSCRTAVELYKNVCERGKWSNLFDAGYNQFKSGNFKSSLSIYMLLSELGYEVAQSNVAYMIDKFERDLVKTQTFERALLNWNRAASQGYTVARIKVGDYHYYGKGTEVDYEVAASHYKTASEIGGSPQALFNLGYMHEQGLGMERDIHLAKRQYDLAAETSPEAVTPVYFALAKLYLLFAVDFIQNQKFAFNFQVPTISTYVGENWDLYLMTILALMLGFVVAFRRQRR